MVPRDSGYLKNFLKSVIQIRNNRTRFIEINFKFICTFIHAGSESVICSVADPNHFDTDPDPVCEKFWYGSGSESRTTFDTDPDPGKNDTDPDPGKRIKGAVSRDFLPQFFYESKPSGPLINKLKWFYLKVCFRGDICRLCTS